MYNLFSFFYPQLSFCFNFFYFIFASSYCFDIKITANVTLDAKPSGDKFTCASQRCSSTSQLQNCKTTKLIRMDEAKKSWSWWRQQICLSCRQCCNNHRRTWQRIIENHYHVCLQMDRGSNWGRRKRKIKRYFSTFLLAEVLSVKKRRKTVLVIINGQN